MSKAKIKKNFIQQLEFFYRNFGSEWTLDDFPKSIIRNKEIIKDFLPELQEKGIIELSEDDSFIITKLPSEFFKEIE